MSKLATDPAYAAKRAQDMHELARRMEVTARNKGLPESLRASAKAIAERAKEISVQMDAFCR